MGMVKVCGTRSQPEVVEMKRREIRHHGIGRLITSWLDLRNRVGSTWAWVGPLGSFVLAVVGPSTWDRLKCALWLLQELWRSMHLNPGFYLYKFLHKKINSLRRNISFLIGLTSSNLSEISGKPINSCNTTSFVWVLNGVPLVYAKKVLRALLRDWGKGIEKSAKIEKFIIAYEREITTIKNQLQKWRC